MELLINTDSGKHVATAPSTVASSLPGFPRLDATAVQLLEEYVRTSTHQISNSTLAALADISMDAELAKTFPSILHGISTYEQISQAALEQPRLKEFLKLSTSLHRSAAHAVHQIHTFETLRGSALNEQELATLTPSLVRLCSTFEMVFPFDLSVQVKRPEHVGDSHAAMVCVDGLLNNMKTTQSVPSLGTLIEMIDIIAEETTRPYEMTRHGRGNALQFALVRSLDIRTSPLTVADLRIFFDRLSQFPESSQQYNFDLRFRSTADSYFEYEKVANKQLSEAEHAFLVNWTSAFEPIDAVGQILSLATLRKGLGREFTVPEQKHLLQLTETNRYRDSIFHLLTKHPAVTDQLFSAHLGDIVEIYRTCGSSLKWGVAGFCDYLAGMTAAKVPAADREAKLKLAIDLIIAERLHSPSRKNPSWDLPDLVDTLHTHDQRTHYTLPLRDMKHFGKIILDWKIHQKGGRINALLQYEREAGSCFTGARLDSAADLISTSLSYGFQQYFFRVVNALEARRGAAYSPEQLQTLETLFSQPPKTPLRRGDNEIKVIMKHVEHVNRELNPRTFTDVCNRITAIRAQLAWLNPNFQQMQGGDDGLVAVAAKRDDLFTPGGLTLEHLEKAAALMKPHGDSQLVAAALLNKAVSDPAGFQEITSIRVPS